MAELCPNFAGREYHGCRAEEKRACACVYACVCVCVCARVRACFAHPSVQALMCCKQGAPKKSCRVESRAAGSSPVREVNCSILADVEIICISDVGTRLDGAVIRHTSGQQHHHTALEFDETLMKSALPRSE
eukprot:1160225-Pelagomonas_calceolata.AAC.2